jgi:sigma-B regulation protein RsbU (phosphoserine phosphatase)
MAIHPGQERLAMTLGGIYLLRPKTAGQVTDSLAAVQSLASQIASALYRAEVYVETLAHQKVAQELALAGRIQATFLPKQAPVISGWDIAATLVPARQTSGDFYDFVEVADGRMGLLVADVADKGTGAALYMALSRTLIRTYALEHPTEPAQVLRAANERILADTASDQFVTLFYGVLELDTGRLTYANAGHNPAYLLRPQAVQELGKTGIPLGMFAGMRWQQNSAQLEPGDVLMLYTDGICEAQDGQATEFGEARLLAVAQTNLGRSAQEIQTALMNAIAGFVGNVPQFDDITLLVAIRLE